MDPSRLPRAPNIWLTQHDRAQTAMATSRLPRAPNTWKHQQQQLRNNWTPVGCPGRQTSGHNKHSSTYIVLPFSTTGLLPEFRNRDDLPARTQLQYYNTPPTISILLPRTRANSSAALLSQDYYMHTDSEPQQWNLQVNQNHGLTHLLLHKH